MPRTLGYHGATQAPDLGHRYYCFGNHRPVARALNPAHALPFRASVGSYLPRRCSTAHSMPLSAVCRGPASTPNHPPWFGRCSPFYVARANSFARAGRSLGQTGACPCHLRHSPPPSLACPPFRVPVLNGNLPEPGGGQAAGDSVWEAISTMPRNINRMPSFCPQVSISPKVGCTRATTAIRAKPPPTIMG